MANMMKTPANIPSTWRVRPSQCASFCLLGEMGWEWPEDSSGIMSTRATYRKMPAVAVNIQAEKEWREPRRRPMTMPTQARTEERML